MTNDGKFWLGVNALIVLLVFLIFTSISSYYTKKNRMMESMVKAGADPISVKCMMEHSMGDDPVCVIHITTRR